jgi:MFS family permease
LLQSLSVLSSGLGLGFPSVASQLLSQDTQVPLTASQVSWFASITAIAAPFGCPLSGFLSDKIGRRNTSILVNFLAIISWIIIGFSSSSDAQTLFVQLMVARVIMGVVIGMSTTPAVMYVSEVCHPTLRGRMTLLSSPFFTAFGLLTIYFLGYLVPVSCFISLITYSFYGNSLIVRLQSCKFDCRCDHSRMSSRFVTAS